ncbi:MAG: hypothetical protein HY698_09000 [Deltaproteobacteria bacterium]|nr:hypothetical protein [Deltaproteobacteria bacterium]
MRSLACLAQVVLFLLVFSTPRNARADGGDFGAGLILGSPTGVSLKLYLGGGSGQAVDAGIGFSLLGAEGLHVHADYLFVPAVLVREAKFDLGLYVGVGGRLLSHDRGHDESDDVHLGARGPVGLVFDFIKAGVPLDAFVEVALILDMILEDDDDKHDGLDLDLNAAFGVRYYF